MSNLNLDASDSRKRHLIFFGDKICLGGTYVLRIRCHQPLSMAFGRFRGGKQITAIYPERRFYKASGQAQTLPRIYSSFREDLFLVADVYLVYEGKNETTGRPIIKAHLNPLVPWIWIGLIIMVFGTLIALVPNAATVRVPATVPAPTPAQVGAGD